MIVLELTLQEMEAIKFALNADLEVIADTIHFDGYAKKKKKHDLYPQALAISTVLSKIAAIDGDDNV